jgi:4-aminobutyrate aminotransferase
MVTHVPYGDAEAIEQTLFQYKMAPEEVAAIFVEALQGEGGYIVPDPAFLGKLRSICDKHGIVLVCDEIQSGAGRTGKWFAFQHAGIIPDIVLMAKGMGSGMPIGAVVAREDIMDWPPGAQGSTYGGNPVACAAAVATLELIESGLMANAARLGEVLMPRLKEIAQQYDVIANPRGLGLMCGVDVVNPATGTGDPDQREKILQAAFRKGLILLPCGSISIRFCPPLNLTDTELEVGLKLFEQAIAAAV